MSTAFGVLIGRFDVVSSVGSFSSEARWGQNKNTIWLLSEKLQRRDKAASASVDPKLTLSSIK
ncbi:hypothetical protein EYF80_005020 [Liparis tanakae]|uniref:Uncharacterized protein n=1 Tax=Liparis tanakae TaxID=230148 RepID=A0A4Z2J2N1_9TELE|nr:hypothetical protein EYF80_005020 [Liparis tanakae]